MPIDRISFSTSQENVNSIGLRSWKKFEASYTIEEGEDKSEARKLLKDYVYESLKKQPEEIPEKVVAKEQVLDEDGKVIADILLCTDIPNLKTFELVSKKNKAIKTAYNQKLNELTIKKTKQLP